MSISLEWGLLYGVPATCFTIILYAINFFVNKVTSNINFTHALSSETFSILYECVVGIRIT